MDRRTQDLTLGVVFFAALATLLGATFYLSDVESLFVARPQVVVDFEEVGGLSAGNSVFVKGYRVGEVGALEYVPGSRKVRAVLKLQRDLELFEGYTVTIEDGTLLGGKQIDIDPGSGENPLPPGTVLTGSYTGGPFDVLADVDSGSLGNIVENVEKFSEGLVNEDGTVWKLLNTSDLYDEVRSLVDGLNEAVAQANDGEGPLNTILYSAEVNAQLENTVANIETASEALNDVEKPVGALLQDTDLADQLRKIIDDVAATTGDIQSDQGLIGRLLRDEKLADDVATIAGELAQTSKKLNDPESGLLGALISDPSVGEQFRNIFDNIESATVSLNGTDSLLGRLLNDPDTAEQFSRILNQVSRAIEDAREAAPVSTFFTVVTGAF